MALTLINEDGTGRTDANSYASAADSDAYHAGHLYATSWTGATADNKAAALVMASRVIDAEFQFNGVKASAAQALQWPRSDCRDPDAVATSSTAGVVASNVVPKGVSDATCELARELLLLDRTAAPPGEGIASDWTATAGKKYSKTDVRPILPRLVQSLLAKYGDPTRQGGGVVKLVRA